MDIFIVIQTSSPPYDENEYKEIIGVYVEKKDALEHCERARREKHYGSIYYDWEQHELIGEIK